MIDFRIVHIGFRIGVVDIGLADSFKMQVAVANMCELAETFDGKRKTLQSILVTVVTFCLELRFYCCKIKNLRVFVFLSEFG